MKIYLAAAVIWTYIQLIQAKGLTCEKGWELREEKCFRVFFPQSGQPISAHMKVCSQQGAHNVHISSKEENDWIADFATKSHTLAGKFPQVLWVLTGAVRTPEGLRWDTGDAQCPLTFENWGPGEPTGDGTNVAMYIHNSKSPFQSWGNSYFGRWNDFTATTGSTDWYSLVCEKAAIGAPAGAASCNYVEEPVTPPSPPPKCNSPFDGCMTIKKSTLLAILDSCSCSEKTDGPSGMEQLLNLPIPVQQQQTAPKK